jgi:hypothetical protein
MEEYIKHNSWFIINDSEAGKTYKMLFRSHGFSYATVSLYEIVDCKKRKWGFFGPLVDGKKEIRITSDSREDDLDPIINRRELYSKSYVARILREILNQRGNSKIVNTINL